jgi:hypothetical protein
MLTDQCLWGGRGHNPHKEADTVLIAPSQGALKAFNRRNRLASDALIIKQFYW